MASNENQGKLLIIGGAEDKEGECKILREFLRCAGGTKAHIVIHDRCDKPAGRSRR